MKTKEELNKLKEEVEAVNEKLAELTPEEIAQFSGGIDLPGSGGVLPDDREQVIGLYGRGSPVSE